MTFRKRRAKAGKGAESKHLLEELWFANNAHDHAIIGQRAGDPKGAAKKAAALADSTRIVEQLLEITHATR